ncbi:MAG: hypothetical protein NTW62_00715 [Candidatus Nomurabacteria bacterium]|nr:hypothetical protein [Candidatus Nomurabacteria bacterium]
MNLPEFKELLNAIPDSETRVKEINKSYFEEQEIKKKNPNFHATGWENIVLGKCPTNLKDDTKTWKGFVSKYNAIKRTAKKCGTTIRELLAREDLIQMYHVK